MKCKKCEHEQYSSNKKAKLNQLQNTCIKLMHFPFDSSKYTFHSKKRNCY